MWGSGLRVEGLGSLGWRVYDSEFRFQGSGFGFSDKHRSLKLGHGTSPALQLLPSIWGLSIINVSYS